MFNRIASVATTRSWAPWLLMGAVVLYAAGYVDSSVHGAAIGAPPSWAPSTSSSTTPGTSPLCATKIISNLVAVVG